MEMGQGFYMPRMVSIYGFTCLDIKEQSFIPNFPLKNFFSKHSRVKIKA